MNSTEEYYSTDSWETTIRDIHAFNRTLITDGYTDEQIMGIINPALRAAKTVDGCFEAAAAALQAELLREGLPCFREITDPAVIERLRAFKSEEAAEKLPED